MVYQTMQRSSARQPAGMLKMTICHRREQGTVKAQVPKSWRGLQSLQRNLPPLKIHLSTCHRRT
jgi:hypothetical protein